MLSVWFIEYPLSFVILPFANRPAILLDSAKILVPGLPYLTLLNLASCWMILVSILISK